MDGAVPHIASNANTPSKEASTQVRSEFGVLVLHSCVFKCPLERGLTPDNAGDMVDRKQQDKQGHGDFQKPRP
jgi:hypothetical protein